MKYSFRNDYSEACHTQILEALAKNNHGQTDGYGEDPYSQKASALIKELSGQDKADVHFLTGGTQTNLVMLSAALRPHESVIATNLAHISTHETGAIEATGHKINELSTIDGKITPEQVEEVVAEHHFEHMVYPKLLFISNTTETGTVYTKAELQALRTVCDKHGLYLYIDGARLGMALTSPANDMSLAEMASYCDAFYIGGTKNGFLFGEALVINNPELQPHFRYHMKQKGALMAKGRSLGIQFYSMLDNELYFDLAEYANLLAAKLSSGIADLGYNFRYAPESNQIFPIFPNEVIDKMMEDYGFYVWEKFNEEKSCVRLVVSWGSSDEQVKSFLRDLEIITK